MNQTTLIGVVLAAGAMAGASITPLIAQQTAPAAPCAVGENSSAACSGNSIYFAGNTSGLDNGVWIVRINGDTGQISYRDGKKLVTLSEPK